MQWLIQIIKKSPKLKKRCLFIIGIFKKSYMFLANKVIGVNRNKIVFISFDGKTYSDNPKAISEKLHQLYPKFEIVWLFNNLQEKSKIVPDYVRCVSNGSYKSLRELATAKFWVDNFCKSLYVYKNKTQIYIQTMHGDRGFKKILYDVRTLLPNGHYKEGDLVEPKICDLALSGSKFADSVYKTAFGYSGEIYTYGLPRNDQLINNDSYKINTIKKSLNINGGTKILLYAPTFKDSKKNELQSFGGIDLIEVLSVLEKKTKTDWVCLIRTHSLVSGFQELKVLSNRVIDVTAYEDMNDLLLISDMLITDYSSSAGDFALLNRPIILFQKDREAFIKNDRKFYFDIDESPYIVAKCQEDIIDIVDKLDLDLAYKNCQDILEFYGTTETGKASEELVKYIISKKDV
jgi:CDP-glycerol glycerophosphotransferase